MLPTGLKKTRKVRNTWVVCCFDRASTEHTVVSMWACDRLHVFVWTRNRNAFAYVYESTCSESIGNYIGMLGQIQAVYEKLHQIQKRISHIRIYNVDKWRIEQLEPGTTTTSITSTRDTIMHAHLSVNFWYSNPSHTVFFLLLMRHAISNSQTTDRYRILI